MRRKSIGICKDQSGNSVMFHGKERVIICNANADLFDSGKLQDFLWAIANEAQEYGESYAKNQVRSALGITSDNLESATK